MNFTNCMVQIVAFCHQRKKILTQMVFSYHLRILRNLKDCIACGLRTRRGWGGVGFWLVKTVPQQIYMNFMAFIKGIESTLFPSTKTHDYVNYKVKVSLSWICLIIIFLWWLSVMELLTPTQFPLLGQGYKWIELLGTVENTPS